MKKIYAASSLVNALTCDGYVYNEVRIRWECEDRDSALANYTEAIEGFGELGTGHAKVAITMLNECFSEEEVIHLGEYLEHLAIPLFRHVRFDSKEVEVPLSSPKLGWHDFHAADRGLCRIVLGNHDDRLPGAPPLDGPLAELRVVGVFTTDDLKPSSHVLRQHDMGLVDHYSTELAKELCLDSGDVVRGVSALWERGLAVVDREQDDGRHTF